MLLHKKVHFVGVGGVSMSALAQIMLQRGVCVSGSDRLASDTTEKLASLGVNIFIGHNASNVEGCDLVVYTAAIPHDNVELLAARQLQIPCLERADFLGQLMLEYDVPIAVSGTHGKTTTTGMLACIFIKARENPSVLIGGNLGCIDGNLKIGGNRYLIFEACEYSDSFLKFNPKIALVLNVEADHLDYFKDLAHIKNSFEKFLVKIPQDGFVVANVHDQNTADLVKSFNGKKITCGTEDSDYFAENIEINENGAYCFDVMFKNVKLAHVSLAVCGRHNVLNSLGAFAVAHQLGLEVGDIVSGLEAFSGTGRRFELKGKKDGVLIYDDYAHHPTEIAATLEVAKQMCGGRVWCVFQPHTYSRTRALMDDFAIALAAADEVIITDIYAAREAPLPGVSAGAIVDRMGAAERARYVADFREIADIILGNAKNGDLVVTMGAGDVFKVADLIVNGG